jgi:hypothetical protein
MMIIVPEHGIKMEKKKNDIETKEGMGFIVRTNEYREKLFSKELEDWVVRIRNLSKEKIDELWFKIGFVYTSKDNNKALPTENIEQIKDSYEYARSAVLSLFIESPIDSIRKNLNNIEKGK